MIRGSPPSSTAGSSLVRVERYVKKQKEIPTTLFPICGDPTSPTCQKNHVCLALCFGQVQLELRLRIAQARLDRCDAQAVLLQAEEADRSRESHSPHPPPPSILTHFLSR